MGSAHRAVSLPVVSAPPLSVRASGRAGPRPQAGPASADPGSMRLGLGWCEPRLAHRALRLWGAQGRPRFGAALQLPASCSESAGGACVRGAVSVDPSSRLPDIGFGLLRSGVSESSPALREGGGFRSVGGIPSGKPGSACRSWFDGGSGPLLRAPGRLHGCWGPLRACLGSSSQCAFFVGSRSPALRASAFSATERPDLPVASQRHGRARRSRDSRASARNALYCFVTCDDEDGVAHGCRLQRRAFPAERARTARATIPFRAAGLNAGRASADVQ